MEEYINITKENINNEHLCCAISDVKHNDGVKNKKEWLKERLSEGHVFRKLNAQGKIFIEYAPLEKSWCAVTGDNYYYIYCLWVAGSFKNKGYANDLLNYAIQDAKNHNKSGICTITTKKKKPFISEKSFFVKYGFEVVDSIGDYELLALKFDDNNVPTFTESAKKMEVEQSGIVIYYSPQCPYTNNCIKEINEYINETNSKVTIFKIDTLEKAKKVPCVFNNWATFKDGKFVSNTLLNKNSIAKL